MKKRISILAAAALLLCACSPLEESEAAENNKPADLGEKGAVTVTEAEEDSPAESVTEPEEESRAEPDEDKSFVSLDLTGSDKEGTTGVGVYGYFERGWLQDLYGVHVLHSGVVGLYSPPVELTCDGLTSAKIQFNVDKDNMGAVPLGNLIMLHYSEEESFYNTVPSVIDYEGYRVTGDITEPGVYLLADAYQWLQCWGVDVSAYQPTPNTDSSPFDDEQHGRYDCLDYGFSMQLPDTATQFNHREAYSCGQYTLSTFSRITSDVYFSLWMDISTIEPAEPMTLEELAEVYMQTRGTIYGNYEHSTIRNIERYEEITSADGVKGLRFIGSDQYYVGDELEEPYESWYDVYPCGDIFLEFHAEYLHKEGSAKEGMEHDIPAEMLASIKFDK